MRHKIDSPAYHPVAFKRNPQDLYYRDIRIVWDSPRGVTYRNGARVTPTSKPTNT